MESGITIFGVLLAVIVALALALAAVIAIAYAKIDTLQTMLKLKSADYDTIMGRALKAETDFTYLKDSIGAILQRPVMAGITDKQIDHLAKTIGMYVMEANPTLKN